MCDQQTYDAVVEVVTDFVNEGRQFTAHDVTVEMRNNGLPDVSHGDVRHAVGDMFAQNLMGSEYTRESVDVPSGLGTMVSVFVYLPVSEDVMDYDPNWCRGKYGKTAPVAPVAPVATPVPVVSPAPVKFSPTGPVAFPVKNTYDVDGRGRLCVRKEDLETVGCLSGDLVLLASLDDGRVVIGRYNSLLKGVCKASYRVDESGDVRIAASTLADCGLGLLSRYSTQIAGNVIEIDLPD